MKKMTTYETMARWGALKLAEEMDIQSDLSPENEAEYVQNFLIEKWVRVFGSKFINGADSITTTAVVPNVCASNLEIQDSTMEVEACQS